MHMFPDDWILYDHLYSALPEEECHAYSLNHAVEKEISKGVIFRKIIDLGCGRGESKLFFNNILPEAQWCGCDIIHSPEVSERKSSSGVVAFDGINLPFKHKAFDLIYCNQVIEHVINPECLLASIREVISDDGQFIASVSYLEPYHSLSTFNTTPYGIFVLLNNTGFVLKRIQAGIDAYSLIGRRFHNRSKNWNIYFRSPSPFSRRLEQRCKRNNLTPKEINYFKLLYCGQFIFWATPKTGLM